MLLGSDKFASTASVHDAAAAEVGLTDTGPCDDWIEEGQGELNRAVMLRIAACGILGLGAALLIAALLLSTYTTNRVAKIPLEVANPTLVSERVGDDPAAIALDPASLTEALRIDGNTETFIIDDNVQDVMMQQGITVEAPSGEDLVTMQVGTTVRRAGDQGDSGLLLAIVDRMTLDRRTALPAGGDADRSALQEPLPIDSEDPALFSPLEDRSGLNYRFPFSVEKKTYPYFDPIARSAYDANYEREEDINGLNTYVFTQNIGYDAEGNITPVYDENRELLEPVRYQSLYDDKVEAEFTATNRQWGLEGEPDEQVTLTRYYAAQRTFWVDPVSGTIVKMREHANHYYASDPLEPLKTVVEYTVTYNEQTVEAQVAGARSERDRIALYSRILPITFTAAGLIALVGGALLGAFGLRAESALIDPGLDSADHGFFGTRGGAPPDRVPGAEAETEKIPTQRPSDLAPPGHQPDDGNKRWP